MYDTFPTDPKLAYNEYIKERPLLYWVDPFGQLIELQNNRFSPQVECGKPVIYLYPPKTTRVSVKITPQAGMSYSDPPYNGGWDVVAEPNGNLHMSSTSAEYPFLFWEGRGNYYEQPKQGWVVKQSDLRWFLTDKLRQLGLNQSETKDFLSFWLIRMQKKPYYFVTFMGNQTMDTIAPLNIYPPPDTVIRILMDYTGLDEPMKAQPYPIRTPVRKGFTVVEWGGVLR